MVNEAFVRRFMSAHDAIGERLIERGSPDGPSRKLEIVGVVEDSMYRFIRESPPPTVYTPLEQLTDEVPSHLTLSVRARGALPGLAQQVVGAMEAADGTVSLTWRTLADQVNAQFAQERLLAQGGMFFAILALVLSAVGVYGVTAFATNRRRVEVGVRLALGAPTADVMRLLLGRIVVAVWVGLVAGVLVALWTGQLVASLLFGVDPRDVATLTASCAAIVVVAAAAVWVPARRATRVELATLLKDE